MMTTMTLLGRRSGEMGGPLPSRFIRGWRLGVALAIAPLSPAIASESDVPMIIKPYESVSFTPLDARRPDGAQIAVLWGDPASGPSAMFLKIPRGVGAPHVHTVDYHLLIVEGLMLHWGPGQAEADAPELRAGSYWFQRGDEVHTDACLSDECVVFVKWSGPRDARIATAAK